MASDSGERRLLQLGYQQELRRVLSHFSNFACAFSVGSILSGVTGNFLLPLQPHSLTLALV